MRTTLQFTDNPRTWQPAGLRTAEPPSWHFTFILVPRKSPDQKQEVSSRIKSKIHFLFGSRTRGEAQGKIRAENTEEKPPERRQTAQTP